MDRLSRCGAIVSNQDPHNILLYGLVPDAIIIRGRQRYFKTYRRHTLSLMSCPQGDNFKKQERFKL
jgi:hypothetical protein